MGTALDGLVILDDPKGSSEEIEKQSRILLLQFSLLLKQVKL